MKHKTLPPFPSSFSRLSEAAALKLRIEQTKAFNFSEQTAKALAQAREDKTPASVTLACRLAASELQGSRELAEAAKTLSLCFALPVSSLKGRVNLAYPVFGAGLGKASWRETDRAGLLDLSEAKENVGDSVSWLRYEGEAPPLARLAWLSLLGSRADLAGAWLSVEGPTQGLNPITEFHSGHAAFTENQRVLATSSKSYHREHGESYDSGPMVRAFSAHAELMSRLLGDTPGPDALYEQARELAGSVGGSAQLEAQLRERGAFWEEGWADFKSMMARRKKSGEAVSNWISGADERALLFYPGSIGGEALLNSSASSEAQQAEASVKEKLKTIQEASKENNFSELSSWALVMEEAALLEICGATPSLQAAREEAWGVAGPAVMGFSVFGSDLASEGELKRSEKLNEKNVRDFIERSNRLGRLVESWRRVQNARNKWVDQEQKTKAVIGLSELFELADSALLGAVEIAKRREEAAFDALGFEGSAKALREAGESADLQTMRMLGDAQELERVRKAEDPLQKMLLAYARLGRANRQWGAGEDAQSMALGTHMRAVASKEELEAFCSSKAGNFYIEALEKNGSGDDRLSQEGTMILYLASLQEFRHPSEPGDALFDKAWKEAAQKLLVGAYNGVHSNWEVDSVRTKMLKAGARFWDTTMSGSADDWSMIVEALGEKEGLSTLERRVKEARAQCAEAARSVMDKALGKPVRDREFVEGACAPLKRGRSPFYALPYGFASDEKIRAYFGGGVKEADLRDPAVAALLKSEGFAGEMGLRAQEFYQDIPMRESADERSRANAWLAAGKRLCKEQLGLSEAGYRLAKEHAGSAKRVASMLGPILKERAAARAALEAPLLEARSRTIEFRRGVRLTRLLGLAAGSGAGPEAAFAVSEAITPGQCASGDLELSELYIHDAMEPMKSGASLSSVIGSLRREAAARGALESRFDAALLERAQELLGEMGEGLSEAQAAKAEKQAIKDLKLELELVQDWAKDSPASFFTQLPPKLRWADLRRGQQAWHEEALKREADSGVGWKAALGSWSDPSTGWSAEELVAPLALAEEGKAMRHCVGGYSGQCRNGSSRIFSLKKNGVRTLTAQFELSSGSCVEGELPLIKGAWRLNQNRGPCNAPPNKEGDAATEALRAALQNAWDERIEQALANPPKASAAIDAETEIAGFNPDMALDLSKWKRNKEEKAPKASAEEALNGLARK